MDLTRLLPQTITQSVSVNLRSVEGFAFPVATELTYDSSDPFAVTVAFQTTEDPIVWTFARELLAQGLLEPMGDGDVHVWPTLDDDGVAIVTVELCSPDGDALVEVRSSDADAFVNRMHAVVAPGQETAYLELDRLIAEIQETGAY
jgi:hypothetical protein